MWLNYVMYGVSDLPWWGYILVTLILTQITIFSVTIFLHRHQAHRALELHPIMSHFFRFWLWLTTATITKEWTAVHRLHHARVETPEDPHSPVTYGIKKVLWQGWELYNQASKNTETLAQFGHGTPDDWLERNLYTRFNNAGIYLMLIINMVLFGMAGITMWAVQMMWIPFFAAGVINGLAHFWGYRNFECQDASRNISPLGILVGGEELHNNHHTYATSAKFSVKPWELDIGWQLIKILRFFGLVHVKKLPPEVELIQGKHQIDASTIKAVINNRFELMSQYTKKVILPLFSEIKAQQSSKTEKSLLSKAKTLLIRDNNNHDDFAKKFLQIILDQHTKLKTVYQLRTKLQDIWSQKTLSTQEVIAALQEWCTQAEATRIEALNRFVNYLKSYNLKVALV